MDYHVQYGPLSPKEASYFLFVYTCIDIISSNVSADAEICKFLAWRAVCLYRCSDHVSLDQWLETGTQYG